MARMQLRGHWNRFRGQVLLGWSRLTGNRRGRINGRMLRMIGSAQVRFGNPRRTFGRLASR